MFREMLMTVFLEHSKGWSRVSEECVMWYHTNLSTLQVWKTRVSCCVSVRQGDLSSQDDLTRTFLRVPTLSTRSARCPGFTIVLRIASGKSLLCVGTFVASRSSVRESFKNALRGCAQRLKTLKFQLPLLIQLRRGKPPARTR